MSATLKLYQINTLSVVQIDAHKIYVDGGEYGVMPLHDPEEDLEKGDKVSAFLYRDTSDCVVATMAESYAKLGECAYLEVISTGNNGAFLDWGLPKDLLLPYSEQAAPVREGNSYVVYVSLDEQERPVASTKLHHYLDEDYSNLEEGQAVNLMIASKTELGFKAVINNQYLGLVFHTELSQPLTLGAKMKGWVKKIRPDGKIDLNVNALDQKTRDELEGRILEQLQEGAGRLELSDKSAPEVIFEAFGVSKKNFKRALGSLYKQRLIKIHPAFIELIDKESITGDDPIVEVDP